MKAIRNLMILRLEKYKERMIDDSSEALRGKASELRDMLKLFVDTVE